jgi:hypothetical protein
MNPQYVDNGGGRWEPQGDIVTKLD